MKFSDGKWTQFVVASTTDPEKAETLRRTFLGNAELAWPGAFFEERAAGDVRAFVVSTIAPDAEGMMFFGWKGDAGVEKPEFSWIRLGASKSGPFSVESDPFGGSPLYFYHDDDVFIASNWLGNVARTMAETGTRMEMDPVGACFSIGIHFVPNGISTLKGIDTFPYGTRAEFPSAGNGRAGVKFEKTSRPVFKESNADMGTTVKAYRRALDEVSEKIFENAPEGKIWLLFTGGLDSSALLSYYKKLGLSDRMVAVTVLDPKFPSKDDENAKTIARDLGIEHRVVELRAEGFFRLPEEIWYAEDPTDVYGYGISLLSAMDANPDVRTFFNGAGTDAAIGSTPVLASAVWNAFYRPEDPIWGSIAGKMFDSPTMADGTNVLEFMKSRNFDRTEWIRILSRHTFVEPWHMGFSRKDFLPGKQWREEDFVWAYRDPYGMEDMDLRFHDLVTLLDYDGLAHRFSDLYKKSSAAKGVSMFSPLGAQSLRQVLFDAPVEYKFNPVCYETGVRDNQLFYKKALWDLLPEIIRHRKKRNGSVPDIRLYLTDSKTKPVALAIFEKFRERGIMSGAFLSKMEKIWHHSDNKWSTGIQQMTNEDVVYYANLSLVWRVLVLEVFLQLFVDGKWLRNDPPSLDLRDYV